MLRLVLILVSSMPMAGCYYIQAAQGQLELNRQREPIDEIIKAEDTPPELAKRLQLVQEARKFSIDELGLPDNDSYRTYADIEREYVVWNVIAAPEFSTQPKTSCFPVAGCVGYRGYFKKEDAVRQGDKLAAKGYDIKVGGVAAYSTLGKFDDPVISSMMNWDDVQLVGTLFHELAHQVLYVKGDTGFNESFATAVEETGLQRWLESRGDDEAIAAYRQSRQLRQDLMSLIARARADLDEIYASDLADEEKRRRKRTRLDALAEAAAGVLRSYGYEANGWVKGELNNASLVAWTLYEGRLPEFRALLEQCAQDLECFYEQSRALAGR